jgi:hypothetical protein
VSVETDVGIGLAAVGTTIAAVSVVVSVRAVGLAHRPYVYGERSGTTTEQGERGAAAIRLRNEGPGAAVEVRFRLGAADAEPTDWTPRVRAMQPGEVHPPESRGGRVVALPIVGDQPAREWYIETEFGDIRGAHWRLVNDRNAPGGVTVKRLRRWKVGLWRLRWIDFWRLDPNS